MSDFAGFHPPLENYSKLPHQLIDELHTFNSLAELKVVLYVMRHTWGYQDDYKRITLDEFQHGRKERDGTRIDEGVGMTKPSIIDGIKRAIEHGFLHSHTDETDNARVKKFYSLTDAGLKSFTSEVKESDSSSKEISHRTEKETKERNSKKETKEKESSALHSEDAPIIPDADSDSHNPVESPESLPVEELAQSDELVSESEEIESPEAAAIEESASQLADVSISALPIAASIVEDIDAEETDPDPIAPDELEAVESSDVVRKAEEFVETVTKKLSPFKEAVRRVVSMPDELADADSKYVALWIGFFCGTLKKTRMKEHREYQLSDTPMTAAQIAGMLLWHRTSPKYNWQKSMNTSPKAMRAYCDEFLALPSLEKWTDEGQKRLDLIMSGASTEKPKSNFATAVKPPDESDMETVDWEAEDRKYEEGKRERQQTNIPA